MRLMIVLAAFAGMSDFKISEMILVAALARNVRFPSKSFGFFVEYWAVFVIGMLVFHRLCRIQSVAIRHVTDAGFAVGLVIAIDVYWFGGVAWPTAVDNTELFRNVYVDLGAAFFSGLLLIGMRPWSERIAASKLFMPLSALGQITFSLYLMHEFNLKLMAVVAQKVASTMTHLPMPEADSMGRWTYLASPDCRVDCPALWLWVWLIVQLLGHVALASVYWYFCERPFLNKAIPAVNAARASR